MYVRRSKYCEHGAELRTAKLFDPPPAPPSRAPPMMSRPNIIKKMLPRYRACVSKIVSHAGISSSSCFRENAGSGRRFSNKWKRDPTLKIMQRAKSSQHCLSLRSFVAAGVLAAGCTARSTHFNMQICRTSDSGAQPGANTARFVGHPTN